MDGAFRQPQQSPTAGNTCSERPGFTDADGNSGSVDLETKARIFSDEALRTIHMLKTVTS